MKFVDLENLDPEKITELPAKKSILVLLIFLKFNNKLIIIKK